jgi:fatty acid/phospholipid biosynthesis enzyme
LHIIETAQEIFTSIEKRLQRHFRRKWTACLRKANIKALRFRLDHGKNGISADIPGLKRGQDGK